MKEDKPFNGQLFKLFDKIINGYLQPQLLGDEDSGEIDKVLGVGGV